jgi:DNA-binding GntR family transcriptional regulator
MIRMKMLAPQSNLVDQVRDALLDEIASGVLPPGARVVQEQIAAALGVSRQPVQQALTLLLSQGVLRERPGGRLVVTPLDADYVSHMYDIREVIEGVACRRAAELHADRARRFGPALIDAGRKAAATGSVPRMIAADMKFHEFLHELSDNSLVAPTLAPHLKYMARVMADMVMRVRTTEDVWNEHERILEAIASGDAELAESLIRRHVRQVADFVVGKLRSGEFRLGNAEHPVDAGAEADASDTSKGRRVLQSGFGEVAGQ